MASNGTKSDFSVDGKVAIVTGGGSGICYEFTKLLLENNCSVVIGDLSLLPEAQELLNKYRKTPRAIFHKTDVSNWTELNSLFETAIEEFGTFEIVCPGAGIYEPLSSNFFHPPGAVGSKSRDPVEGLGHYAIFDINVTHPIRATQLALAEYMTPSKDGSRASTTNPKRVVHVCSVAAQSAGLIAPLYVATKHALNGFVRSMAQLEEACGVRINAVCPGMVKTPLWTVNPEKLRAVDESTDVWCTPRQVAELMLQLVESAEYAGGDMVEIGAENTRKVPQFNNPGPSGTGFSLGNRDALVNEQLALLATPGWGKVSGH